MTLTAPMRCSAVAEQLGEPMIGTADHRTRWLLLEDRSAWGSDAVAEVLGRERAAALKSAGVRAVLVRRREGDPSADAIRRSILVDTATREMAVRTVRSIDELDASEVTSTPVAAWGAPLTDPIVLVCSNGKRDACCAVRGRLVLAALAAAHEARTWECSHLGGHRFAANLVCLPHGLIYGRVPPARASALVDEYLDGRVDPALLRGRSAWPGPAQVAEQALRTELGVTGVDEVELLSIDVAGTRATVRVSVGRAHRAVELVAEPSPPPRAISCRADELEEPIHWTVVR